ncbi:MAG: hypothetical protein H0U36_02655 [Nocardioidaceae bacterium]|nr:hypothetical protein [Nocardioidaceae bacterium]
MNVHPELGRAETPRGRELAPLTVDPGNRVDTAPGAHYRAVGDVCGHTVRLHDGTHRHLAPTPAASACGPGEQ